MKKQINVIFRRVLRFIKRALLTTTALLFLSALWGRAYLHIETEAVMYAKSIYMNYIDEKAREYGYVIPEIKPRPLTHKEIAVEKARKYGVPTSLFLAIIKWESRWNPQAISKAGCVGLGQVNPSNAKFCGYTVKELTENPEANLDCSARLAADAIRQSGGDWVLALQLYNSSPKNVGKTPENRAYANNVFSMLQ